VYERLVQSRSPRQRGGRDLKVQRPNHYTTKPHKNLAPAVFTTLLSCGLCLNTNVLFGTTISPHHSQTNYCRNGHYE